MNKDKIYRQNIKALDDLGVVDLTLPNFNTKEKLKECMVGVAKELQQRHNHYRNHNEVRKSVERKIIKSKIRILEDNIKYIKKRFG
jgi:hypothetical protein